MVEFAFLMGRGRLQWRAGVHPRPVMAREHENTRTCGGLGMLHHARKGVSLNLASLTDAETRVVVEGIHDCIYFDTVVGHQKGLLYPHMRGHAPSAGVSGFFCPAQRGCRTLSGPEGYVGGRR